MTTKREKEHQFLERMGDMIHAHKGGDDVPCSFTEFERLYKACLRWQKLETEAAQYVESPIAMRTHFHGEQPYVGWKGLGKALEETFDTMDIMRDALERIRDDGNVTAEDALEKCRKIKNKYPEPSDD